MLSSTNMRVQEIADKLDFENQFNFTRAFKRVSGIAPTEYRATCLQRADFARGSGRDGRRIDLDNAADTGYIV